MKYKIDIAPLADYYVVAVKDKDTEELKDSFTLNESGADMLRRFCEGKRTEVVAKEMAEMYDCPEDLVFKDVIKLKERLNKKGLTF